MTDPNEHKIGFENLPNVYFKRLRTRISSLSQNVVVSGYFTIFEGKEQKYWDDDEYFRSYLRIRLRVFRSENRAAVIPAIGGLVEQIGDEHFIYGPFDGNKPIPFAIEVPKDKTYGLYLSANLEMDLDNIPDVDFNWTEDQWYRGPTTEERIFDNNDKLLSMFRYVNGDNAHFGPVHTHMAAGMFPIVMKGSFHVDPTTGERRGPHQVLTKEEVNDLPLNKNYYVEDIFDEIRTQSNIPRRPPPIFMTNFASEQKSVYFHIFISDSNLAVKTKVGRTLYMLNPEYFRRVNDKVEVNRIEVSRERKELGFLQTGPGPIPNSIATSTTTQIYSDTVGSAEYPGDRMQKTFFASNNIDEPEVKSTIYRHAFRVNDDVAVYAVTDFDVSPTDDQIFTYSVRVDFISLLDEMLRDIMKEMRQYVAHIQSCYQTFYTNSEFYDHEAQMLKPLGFVELNKEYGFILNEVEDGIEYQPSLDKRRQQREAYWTKVPHLYSKLIKFLERGNNPRQDYLTLFNLLNPISASPETLSTAILKISRVMTTISQTYDLFSSPAFNATNLSLPSSPPDIYSFAFDSNETVNHPAYLATVPQFDYLADGPNFLGPNDDNNMTVFAGAFLQRADTELGEFAYDLPKIGPEDLPDYSQRQKTEINSNVGSYSFLTPRMAFIQGQQINLTSLEPDETDKLKIFKASTSPKLGIKAAKVGKNLLEKKTTSTEPNDVREYVGDDSLFALTSPDTLFKKISKIKPQISTTALNFYSSKGRNFNLEELKKTKLSTKMMPPSLKSILRTDFKNIDPFQNLQTRDAFFNKFFNVIQISYLSGFEIMFDGYLLNISKPIYKPITKKELSKTKSYLICKSEPVNILSTLNSSYEEIQKKNIKNSVFIVKGSNVL
tara:strand:+ start:1602 stop:4262 length:2661 start_codon:yes stop_codon:yes gene_type:complete